MVPLTEREILASFNLARRSTRRARLEARASGSGCWWVVMRMFFLPLRMLSSFLARGRWRDSRSTETARPMAVSTQDSTKEVIWPASWESGGAVWLSGVTTFHRLARDEA